MPTSAGTEPWRCAGERRRPVTRPEVREPRERLLRLRRRQVHRRGLSSWVRLALLLQLVQVEGEGHVREGSLGKAEARRQVREDRARAQVFFLGGFMYALISSLQRTVPLLTDCRQTRRNQARRQAVVGYRPLRAGRGAICNLTAPRNGAKSAEMRISYGISSHIHQWGRGRPSPLEGTGTPPRPQARTRGGAAFPHRTHITHAVGRRKPARRHNQPKGTTR